MKKVTLSVAVLAGLFLFSSCYTYKFNEGDGPQTNVQITEKNHYFVFGLAPGKISNPKDMAGNAQNYRVEIEHSFVDGLIAAITLGIYTPTTTTITK